jgi:DNA helicase IV
MCKPVIAIDEAADFSVIELLAMHSFRHPDISSVTISGDLMQRMTGNGLQNWESFTGMVESPLIENLTKSYRQSPTLLSIAQDIYRYSTEKNAEYTSYMDNDPSEPKPLMIISEDPTDRLVWIADRIREIDTIYRASVGALPSVAVFVPYENDIESFRSELDEKLDGDFDIINGSVAGGRGAIKVYAVNKVKGLEFEAAFFHDLDKLETLEDNLLLKYLYVGLSRATFYLGITLSKNLKNELRFIEERFTKNGRWKEARPEETKNDNDGNDD